MSFGKRYLKRPPEKSLTGSAPVCPEIQAEILSHPEIGAQFAYCAECFNMLARFAMLEHRPEMVIRSELWDVFMMDAPLQEDPFVLEKVDIYPHKAPDKRP